jgi:hypothetical protein
VAQASKVKGHSLFLFPFIVNWFVAVKETKKKNHLRVPGYLGTADRIILIVRSGSLEQREKTHITPLGRGRWRRRSGWRSFTFVLLHRRATRPKHVLKITVCLLYYLPVTWFLAFEPYICRKERGRANYFLYTYVSLLLRKEYMCDLCTVEPFCIEFCDEFSDPALEGSILNRFSKISSRLQWIATVYPQNCGPHTN